VSIHVYVFERIETDPKDTVVVAEGEVYMWTTALANEKHGTSSLLFQP